MSEPQVTTTTEGTGDPVLAQTGTAQPSNAEIKNSDLFQKVAAEAGELRREKAERLTAEDATKKDAETKRLAEEGRFEEALKQKETEVETLKRQHEGQLRERDLGNELLKAGFNNDTFVRGAVNGYNPEGGTIADYVQALAADEGNKAFLSNGQGRQPHTPPGNPNVTNPGTPLNYESAKALSLSGTPEEKTRAREFLSKHHLSQMG
jgi:hypothetical protein